MLHGSFGNMVMHILGTVGFWDRSPECFVCTVVIFCWLILDHCPVPFWTGVWRTMMKGLCMYRYNQNLAIQLT